MRSSNSKSELCHLFDAVQRGDVDAVRALLEKEDVTKEFINSPDNYGRTPLIIAMFNGNYVLVELLLQKGADPRIQTEKCGGAIALRFACLDGRPDLVRLLLDYGAYKDLDQPLVVKLIMSILEDLEDKGAAQKIKLLLEKCRTHLDMVKLCGENGFDYEKFCRGEGGAIMPGGRILVEIKYCQFLGCP